MRGELLQQAQEEYGALTRSCIASGPEARLPVPVPEHIACSCGSGSAVVDAEVVYVVGSPFLDNHLATMLNGWWGDEKMASWNFVLASRYFW